MVKIHLKKQDILLTVLDFLKTNGYIESMRCLEHESGLTVDNYGNDMDFLRNLILDGQWDDAENFVSPLEKKSQENDFDFQRVMFEIRKQRFLELVDGRDQAGAVDALTDGLKQLEGRCSKEEFNKLCYCLTLETLNDHPDYASWTPYQGRLECFTAVRTLFDRVFAGEWMAQRDAAARVEPNHLITLLQQSALYQASLYMAATSTTTLPNPIHFDVLSPAFRPLDANGKQVGPPGRRQHGEPKLVPGNVMRHMQRKLGVGGLTGKALPVPGVVIEGANLLGPQASPRINNVSLTSKNAGRATAGQPLRSSWGWGNGSSRLTHHEISKVKKMVDEYGKPREPLPLKSNTKYKKAQKWEISNEQEGKEVDVDQIVKNIQDEDDNNNLNEGKMNSDASDTNRSVEGKSQERNTNTMKVKEVISQSTDFSQKEDDDMKKEEEGVKDEEEEIVVQKQKPVEPREREGPLDSSRVRKLQCMAQCTEAQPIRTVNFSPDGKTLAIGTNGCALKICAVPSVSQFDQIAKVLNRSISANLKLKTIEVFDDLHLGSVYATSFSKDGKLIATASNDMTIKVVRLGSSHLDRRARGSRKTDDNDDEEEEDYEPPPTNLKEHGMITFVGHEGTVRDVSFCGDSTRLVSGGAGDFHLRVWDVSLASEDNECLLTMKGHTNCIYALNCDIEGEEGNRMVLSAGADKTIRLWDLRSGTCVSVMGNIGGNVGGDTDLEASSELPSASDILSLSTNPMSPWTVSSGHKDGSINVWDLRAQRLSWTIQAHGAECRSVDYSSDGRWLLSSSFDNSINVTDCDIWERRIVSTYSDHRNKVLRATWHPSRPIFASCSADKTVRLWGPRVDA